MNNEQQPIPPVQPAPQTSDFLNRMDMASGNIAPEKPKKKLSMPIIIGIVVGVIAIVGVIVAVIMMNSSSTPQPTATVTTTWPDEPEEEELSEEVIERNKLRANDLVSLAKALDQYQLKNSDAVPVEVEQWEWMIRTYIPEGLKDLATGEPYRVVEICKFGEACTDLNSMTWENNQHQVYVMLNAACNGNTKESLLVSYTGKRKAAMFTILEGSQTFLCVNN